MVRPVQYLSKVFQSVDVAGQFLTYLRHVGVAERLPSTWRLPYLPDDPSRELPQQDLLHRNVRAAMILDL